MLKTLAKDKEKVSELWKRLDMVRFCSDCGTEIGETDKFCKSCGKSLNAEVRKSERLISLHEDFLKMFQKLQPLAFLGSFSLVLATFSKDYPQVSEYASFAGIFFLLAFAFSALYLSPLFDKNTGLEDFQIVNIWSSFPLSSIVFAVIGIIFLIAAGWDLVKDKPIFSFTAGLILVVIISLILSLVNASFIPIINNLFPKRLQNVLKTFFSFNIMLLLLLFLNLIYKFVTVSVEFYSNLFYFIVVTTFLGYLILILQMKKKKGEVRS